MAADLYGTGKLDLAVSDYVGGTVSVLAGNGDGTFGPAQSFADAPGSNGIAVDDVNGDGELDLVVANQDANTASLLLNQSLQATVGQPLTTPLVRSPTATPSWTKAISHPPSPGATGKPTSRLDGVQGDGLGNFYLTAGHTFTATGVYQEPP